VCASGTIDDAPTQPLDAGSDGAPTLDAPVNISGCADGEREAFPSLTTHPAIAGCGATWADTADLRAARTNTPCGDDLGTCGAPADACQIGWHICGTAGDPAELSSRATESECAGAGGADAAYVAAMSHCTEVPCVYDLPLPCTTSGNCSEPVCCGDGCRTDQGCLEAVYTVTAITDTVNGCGNLPSSLVTGVLCCQ
jgi:hypothetical protein